MWSSWNSSRLNHIMKGISAHSGTLYYKGMLRNCVICNKQRSKRMECEFPPLSIERVRDALVFEVTGVDFAGPFYLKGVGKAWISLFTCAVYRTVHLELASSPDIACFINCLHKFIARRGRPKHLFCDDGKNIVGT